MTNILLTILGLALACLVLSYFFVPARLFDALVFFTRFRAKLNVRYCDVDGHQMPYLMGGGPDHHWFYCMGLVRIKITGLL